MRRPLLAKSRPRLQVSKVVGFAPPVGGINARDPLTGMAKTDAIYMTNIYPRGNYLEVRGGNASHATGMTGNGKTLALYSSMTGGEGMYCATPSGIYLTTGAGAVGAAVLARTDGKHQWVNYGDGTNNWLIMVNGVDKPAYYNGATWTAVDAVSVPALTGVTSTNLIGVCVYQGRLFFIEKDTLKTWYLPSGVVGGVLTAFDLSTQAARGGYLMAAMNWTFDGGSGSDDHIAFVTSMGEVIVYQGVDPGAAATWSKVGTYYIGKPIGRQCMCKYGGDLIVLTEDGIIGLSGALSGVVNESKYKLSDKIRNLYIARVKTYRDVYGWQMVVYPTENALIVNIPATDTSNPNSQQLVMNSQTGSWCTFNGWSASSFCVSNSALYYASGTKTVKAWTGVSDDANSSTSITTFMLSAYSNLGSPNFKDIKALRFQTIGNTSATQVRLAVIVEISDNPSIPGQSLVELAANKASKTWFAPQNYGGTWIAAWWNNSDAVNGGLLKINTLEYVYEEGSVSSI